MAWRPSDWLYHAEGGKHAIFGHVKQPAVDRHAAGDFVGRVLRVSKRDLAFAYTAFGDASTDDAASAAAVSCLDKPNEVNVVEMLFQRSVVQPLLGQSYLDLPQQITLPSMFCAQLYHLAFSSGNIPSSRLPSWSIDDGPEMKKTISKCNFSIGMIATLLRDYTTLMGHRPGKNVISVEIKPKAGYITTSPLVSPPNRCKYYRTRYSLQQELMESGQIQKGWCKQNNQNGKSNSKPSSFTPSNYSPLDLFSGDLSRIQSALKDLSNNMQNNFRVFHNGTQIFGEDIMPSDEESKAILDELFPQCTNNLDAINNIRLLDLIAGIIAKVLHREELLRNLLSMQLLDAIDADGAIKVYERLVHLCDGSNSKAEELLDKAMLCVQSDGVEQRSKKPLLLHENNLTATSPYDLPNCASLHILLEEINKFQPHHPDTDVNAFHARCIQMVGQLSQEGCIYLLQNWLLSLTMCDVSFFVTFQCHLLTDDTQCPTEELQSIDHGGIMRYYEKEGQEQRVSNGTHTMIHYEVKVVDCDAKPAKKLRKRKEVEDKFQFITSS
jgi:inositol-pentakisphosphate 2-kinase